MREVDDDAWLREGRQAPADEQREVGNGEAGADVPHHRAQEELEEHDGASRRPRRCRMPDRSPVGSAASHSRDVAVGEGDHEAEEGLGQAGVGDRDRRRQQVDDGEPTQDALRHDRGEGAPGEPPHAAPRLGPPGPKGQHQGEQAPTALAAMRWPCS